MPEMACHDGDFTVLLTTRHLLLSCGPTHRARACSCVALSLREVPESRPVIFDQRFCVRSLRIFAEPMIVLLRRISWTTPTSAASETLDPDQSLLDHRTHELAVLGVDLTPGQTARAARVGRLLGVQQPL